MPLKLVPPKAGRTPYYHIRGTYLGIAINRSARTDRKKIAAQAKTAVEAAIERGEFAVEPAPKTETVTFLAATVAYLKANGEADFLSPIIDYAGEHAIRDKPIEVIGQIELDNLAVAIYPKATPQTRNRQVYTPVAAVLHRAGIKAKFLRPKGWRGSKATSWLEPDAAFALLAIADDMDREFGLLCTTLLYSGMRINEALSAKLCDLHLDHAFLYLPETKNSEARAQFLPPVVVAKFRAMPPRPKRSGGRQQDHAGIPFLDRHQQSRIFRFHMGGHLRGMLKEALRRAALSFPRRQGGFHLFCHTYGTWMHRYAGLDNFALTRTERWRDPRSAERYLHTDVNAEAKMAALLPVPTASTKKRAGLVQRRSGRG